jgi:hypothetical protein
VDDPDVDDVVTVFSRPANRGSIFFASNYYTFVPADFSAVTVSVTVVPELPLLLLINDELVDWVESTLKADIPVVVVLVFYFFPPPKIPIPSNFSFKSYFFFVSFSTGATPFFEGGNGIYEGAGGYGVTMGGGGVEDD